MSSSAIFEAVRVDSVSQNGANNCGYKTAFFIRLNFVHIFVKNYFS